MDLTGLKVMVIDDSNTIRRSAEMFLKPSGCEMILAQDGFDALSKIVDHQPNVIFVDIGSVKISHAKKSEDRRKVALVVDDSLTMRKVLSRLLEREGYRVETATHGIDALQRLQEVSPNVILTDIEMPNMDGFELVRQLKSDDATAKTPIIMISSRTAEKHQALAKTLGVNVFMGKPIQDEALIANITFLLA